MSEKVKRAKKPKSKVRQIIEWVLFGIFGVAFAFVLAGNIDGMVHKNENYGYSLRFGMGTFVIWTNSMEPDIKVNDAIVTIKEDVSTFKDRLASGETIDVTFFNIPIGIAIEPDTPEFRKANGGKVANVPTPMAMTHRLREVHINEQAKFGEGRYVFVAAGINHNPGGTDEKNYALEGQYQLFTEKEYLGTVKITNSALGHFMSFVSSAWGLIILLLIPAAYLIIVSSIDIFKTLKENEEAQEASSKEGHLSKVSVKDKERLKKELLEEMMKAKQEEKKDE